MKQRAKIQRKRDSVYKPQLKKEKSVRKIHKVKKDKPLFSVQDVEDMYKNHDSPVMNLNSKAKHKQNLSSQTEQKDINQQDSPPQIMNSTAQSSLSLLEKKEIAHSRMPNHIQDFFTDVEGSKELINSKEIFTADPENVDVKTELDHDEIRVMNKLMFNDQVLIKHGLDPVFSIYANQFMRLKISFQRKSRVEFVDINRQNNTQEMMSGLQGLSNVSTIKNSQQ